MPSKPKQESKTKKKSSAVVGRDVTINIPRIKFSDDGREYIGVHIVWGDSASEVRLHKGMPLQIMFRELEIIINEQLLEGLKNGKVFKLK